MDNLLTLAITMTGSSTQPEVTVTAKSYEFSRENDLTSSSMLTPVIQNENFQSNLELDTDPSLPPLDYTQMSENSKYCVIVYSIIFLIAASGNLSVFLSVCKQMRKFRTRLSLLILHLSVADLIVTFFLIPMEILWRISVQWYGGNVLCKVCQFFRAFGLYLSSMIIICISLDRFFAILYPLKVMNGQRRVKHMIIVAWIIAIICSAPQSIIFSVKSHPIYTSFQQCVTIGFFTTREEEILYNVFSVSVMYFVPLLVIIFTYSMILWKIASKTREQQQVLYIISNSLKSNNTGKGYENGLVKAPTVNSHPGGGTNNTTSPVPIPNEVTESATATPKIGARQPLTLRRSDNGVSNITRARNRTLRLTIVIVIVFLFCATPYVFMTLWYMFDRESAVKVDGRIQDGFFMMAVANSCVNPLIYGSYSKFSHSWCGLSCCFPKYFRPRRVATGSKSPIRNNTIVPTGGGAGAGKPKVEDLNELRNNLERKLRETLQKPNAIHSCSNLQKNLNHLNSV